MLYDFINKMKKGTADKGLTGRRVVAFLLFGAIAMVFVFFGLSGRLGGAGIGSVASVGNTLISISDFQREEQRIKDYYSNMFGGSQNFNLQESLFKEQAVESLINNEVIHQIANHEKIMVADAELANRIVEIPAFQKDGRFQKEYYNNYLSYTRQKAGDFEGTMAKQIQTQRIRNLFEKALKPTTLETEKDKALSTIQVNIAYIKMTEDALSGRVQISQADVTAGLANADTMKRADEYFKAHQSEFTNLEEVKAQHILIAVPKDEAGIKKANAKLEEVKKQIGKTDFGQLAAKYSDDPGSKAKNGDLGFFPRGNMVKPFEDAAFSLPIGKISDPIKTAYGYHFIRVNEKKPARAADFETQKSDIVQKLLKREKSDVIVKEFETALAEKNANKVDELAKTYGLGWDETGFFDISAEQVPKLGTGALATAAFELTPENKLAARLTRDGSDKYILKLKDYKVSAVATKSANTQEDFLQKRRGSSAFAAWVDGYRKQITITRNPNVFAKE